MKIFLFLIVLALANIYGTSISESSKAKSVGRTPKILTYSTTTVKALGKIKKAQKCKSNSDGSPTTNRSVSTTKFVPNAQNCHGKKYCEFRGRGYPEKHIRKQLAMKGKSKDVKMFLKSNWKEELKETNKSHWLPLCDSKTSVIRPKIARNKHKKWMYILNLEDHSVRQQLSIEICKDTGVCSMRDHFPIGYTFSCTQRYVYRRLAAINYKGRPVIDVFELPSACACFYRTRGSSQKTEKHKTSLAVTQKKQPDEKNKENKERRHKDKESRKKKN